MRSMIWRALYCTSSAHAGSTLSTSVAPGRPLSAASISSSDRSTRRGHLRRSGAVKAASSRPAMAGQSVIRVAAENPYFSKALRVSRGTKLPTALTP